jgi:hypothetical protein
MLWQLKRLSTGETLNEPQNLPENWGSIFGMGGVKDRLGDLSWLGDAYADQGWFEVAPAPPAEPTREDKIAAAQAQIELRINESNPMVAADNSVMTKSKRVEWLVYRQAVKEVYLQAGYPDSIMWPTPPNEL